MPPPSSPDDALLQQVLQQCVVHPSHMLSLLSDAAPEADPTTWEAAAAQLWDLSSDLLACRFLCAHGLHVLLVTTLDDALHRMQEAADAPRRVEVCCGVLANLTSLACEASYVVVQDDALAQLVVMLLGGADGPPLCTDAAALAEAVRLLDAAARLPQCNDTCSCGWRKLLQAPWLLRCCLWLASNTLRAVLLQRWCVFFTRGVVKCFKHVDVCFLPAGIVCFLLFF